MRRNINDALDFAFRCLLPHVNMDSVRSLTAVCEALYQVYRKHPSFTRIRTKNCLTAVRVKRDASKDVRLSGNWRDGGTST